MKSFVFFLFLILIASFSSSQTKPVIDWVKIEPGSFMMGSNDDEVDREQEEEQHKVNMHGYYISKYEVTFEQYDAFCDATGREKPNDKGWGRGKHPVIHVSWDDAMAFAEWMGCRLPTEAEWEYACKANTTGPFSTGATLSVKQANFDGEYPYNGAPEETGVGKTVPVGSYPANPWGIHDMHGNVSEWCVDDYEDYSEAEATHPKIITDGASKVNRGCAWDDEAKRCRSAKRFSSVHSEKQENIGFRLAKDL